jgi:hypothetical protein
VGALDMCDTYELYPCSCPLPNAADDSAPACPGCDGVPLRQLLQRDDRGDADDRVCTEEACVREGERLVLFFGRWRCRARCCPSNPQPPTFTVEDLTPAEAERGVCRKRLHDEDDAEVGRKLLAAQLDAAQLRLDNDLLRRQMKKAVRREHLRTLHADALRRSVQENTSELEAMRAAKIEMAEGAVKGNELEDNVRKRLECCVCLENLGTYGFGCCATRLCGGCIPYLRGNTCPGCRAPITGEAEDKSQDILEDIAPFLGLGVDADAMPSASGETTAPRDGLFDTTDSDDDSEPLPEVILSVH